MLGVFTASSNKEEGCVYGMEGKMSKSAEFIFYTFLKKLDIEREEYLL